MLTLSEFFKASNRIRPWIRKTPLIRSDYLSHISSGEIYLKLESVQVLGAFKIRGMANRVLTMTPAQRRRTILVVSSGNHAVAASYCGRLWGLEVIVVIPTTTARTKVDKIRRYGARLIQAGTNYDEASRVALELLASNPDWLLIDPTSDPDVVTGYGTIGLELSREVPDLEEVLVPVGGGGLITGIGLACKSMLEGISVTGIQTRACPAMVASLEAGHPFREYPSGASICGALIGGVGDLPFELASRSLDRVDTVSEDRIAEAVLTLLEHDKVVSEPSGAVGVAYVMDNPHLFEGRRVAVVVSGSNVDLPLLAEIIRQERGP